MDTNNDSVRALWDGMSGMYYKVLNCNTVPIMAQLAVLGRIDNKYRILDAGCGPGLSTALLISQAPRKDSVIYAYDYSSKMIEYSVQEISNNDDFNCNKSNHWQFEEYSIGTQLNIEKDIEEIRKTKDGKIVKLFVGNSEDLIFQKDQFDLYISNLVLSSVGDPYKTLVEAFRVLKEDGVLVFSVWGKKENTKHKRYFEDSFVKCGIEDTSNRDAPFKVGEDTSQLKQTLQTIGFRNVHLAYTDLVYDVYSDEEFFKKFRNTSIEKVLSQLSKEKQEEYLTFVRKRIKNELIIPGDLPSLNILLILMEVLIKSQTCEEHKIKFAYCSFPECPYQKICKFCALSSKEQTQHYAEHFDSIKHELNLSLDDVKAKCKSDEIFDEANGFFLSTAKTEIGKVDSIFEALEERRNVMVAQIIEGMLLTYSDVTDGFEDLVKRLTEKLGQLSTSDSKLKSEVATMKKELDEKMSYLTNQTRFASKFEEKTNLILKTLHSLKVVDIINNKFNFAKGKNIGNTEWREGGSICRTNKRGGSYWAMTSVEVLSGPFECKIRINRINESSVSGYWNYSIGLQKATSSNQDSYYNDSVVFQSCGWIAAPFSGSGSHKQIIFSNWKTGDILLMKRDEMNNVWFGLNSETSYAKGFDTIIGDFKIIMGFGGSVDNDEFEFLELIK